MRRCSQDESPAIKNNTSIMRRYEHDHEIDQPVRKFHSDEEGLEALQVVMIIAIAGMILVAAGTVGSRLSTS